MIQVSKSHHYLNLYHLCIIFLWTSFLSGSTTQSFLEIDLELLFWLLDPVQSTIYGKLSAKQSGYSLQGFWWVGFIISSTLFYRNLTIWVSRWWLWWFAFWPEQGDELGLCLDLGLELGMYFSLKHIIGRHRLMPNGKCVCSRLAKI